MIGTCTLRRIINVIRESEIYRLTIQWAMVRMSQLLPKRGSAFPALEEGDNASIESEAGACATPVEVEVAKPITMRESVDLGPFQMKIIEGKVKHLLGETAHVMVTPLKAGKVQSSGAHPLPPGLHAYTHLKNGSKKVSVMVRNMSDSHIYLKKGAQVARVISPHCRFPWWSYPWRWKLPWEQRHGQSPCLWPQDRRSF